MSVALYPHGSLLATLACNCYKPHGSYTKRHRSWCLGSKSLYNTPYHTATCGRICSDYLDSLLAARVTAEFKMKTSPLARHYQRNVEPMHANNSLRFLLHGTERQISILSSLGPTALASSFFESVALLLRACTRFTSLSY